MRHVIYTMIDWEHSNMIIIMAHGKKITIERCRKSIDSFLKAMNDPSIRWYSFTKT